MEILDGKIASAAWLDQIAAQVKIITQTGQRPPCLAAILVGGDGASQTYVASKERHCKQVGFESHIIRLDDTISQQALLDQIISINQNPNIDGLIVQSPLPKHISFDAVVEAIDPAKDVDGFHPLNVGRMAKGLPSYIAATPKGILQLLNYYKIQTSGTHCVVLGRSQIVGTPMSILLSQNKEYGNATVTLCHSKTKNLDSILKTADILIAAIGIPNFVGPEHVQTGAVVIDVGISRVADSSKKSGFALKGDVDFERVAPLCSYITPVPGGVGLMTIGGLLHNTLLAAQKSIYV